MADHLPDHRQSRKRQRTNSNSSERFSLDEQKIAVENVPRDDDAENDLNVLGLFDGDQFVDQKSNEEKQVEEMRRRRRERLSKIKKEEENEQNVVEKPVTNQTRVSGSDETEKSSGRIETRPTAEEEKGSSSGEGFDMFSSSVSPISVDETKRGGLNRIMSDGPRGQTAASNNKRGHEQSDWDDSEGYYKAVIGESIQLQQHQASENATKELYAPNNFGPLSFKVAGVVGKGVFSTVLKCSTINNATSIELPPTIAMKCVRHNETMAKAAAHEIKFLQQLKGSKGVVPLLLPMKGSIEYRGHMVLVFPYMEYNLRDVLVKFGKGVGLSLQAVRSYFGQLLSAATHLKKHGIIHADLKPDNILVSGDFSTVQLADFGSAFEATTPENQPTPYLVSRFYRAPEIILGITPTIAIDLWSLSVTVAEIFLGDVLFRGKSNNDMLYVFMQHMGPFSNRMIRQHLVQSQKIPNIIPRQFKQEGTSYVFTQQTVDPVSGGNVHKILPLVMSYNNTPSGGTNAKFPLATPLHTKVIKAKSPKDSKTSVMDFSDLLQKCLVLDPSRRLSVSDALQHKFFQSDNSTSTA